MDLAIVQRELQATELLKKLGLDFKIEKRPLVDITEQLLHPENDFILPEETPFYSLKNMKTGKHIHCVKKGYVVSQNEDIIKLVLKGIRGFGELSVEGGGSINGGRKIFIQLRVDGYEPFGNDKIKKYITVLDSNDGSASVSVGIGNEIYSCTNQFFHFYKQGMSKMRHSLTLEKKMEELPYLITTAMQEHMRMIELYKDFESSRISDDLSHRMVNHIMGIDRTIDKDELKKLSTRRINKMNSLYKHINKELKNKGDNLWGLFNGVTSWTTHERSVPKRENGRIESLMMGSSYKESNKALQFCSNLVSKIEMN